MYIVYFILWVIMNGKWTVEIGIFGAIFAAVLYAFSCAFLGWSPKMDAQCAKGMASGIRYLAVLVREIVLANLAVMRRILSGTEVKPQLVHFKAPVKSEGLQVVLADSITLTPGTITCSLKDGEYFVHCLDEDMADGLDNGVFVQQLEEIERRKA